MTPWLEVCTCPVPAQAGNLTLTGFNSELQARPFLEKKNDKEWGYIHSPIWLSKSIAAEDIWGPAQIESHATMLAGRALHVWKVLEADPC